MEKINNPLISVIVPVYNSEKFISNCLESIKRQTYLNWECIVVDDGSTDNSGIICDQYTEIDKRFTVIHKINSGVSNARNTGINKAKGRFITFVDSDDYIESEYLEDFINHNPQDASIIISGLATKTPTSKYISFQYADESTDKTPASELIEKYDIFRDGGPVNKLFDLELIKKKNIYFQTKLSYHEDHIFIYTYLLHAEHIILSKYCGYNYMFYGIDSANSLSRQGKKKTNSLILASDIFLNLLPKLFDKYNINNTLYKDKVLTRTGFSQRILAIFNLYVYTNTPPKSCEIILDKERDFFKYIYKHYYPLTFKRKIFINILTYPIYITHHVLLMFRIFFRIKFAIK